MSPEKYYNDEPITYNNHDVTIRPVPNSLNWSLECNDLLCRYRETDITSLIDARAMSTIHYETYNES